MIFNDKLSRMMSRAIKANTTTTEREGVAALHDMSIHTLNSVINMQRNIVKSNAPALIDIIQIAIENANRCGVSLTRYAEMAKAAEAAQSNETKQKAN